MSKGVLYTVPPSIWATVPSLAIIELGYKEGTFEERHVNLAEAENYKPEFYKISPNATLPVLVVDGQTYTSTTDVTKYLVEHAPTTAQAGKHLDVIEAVHGDDLDPNFPVVASRSKEELAAKKAGFVGKFVSGRHSAVKALSDNAPDDEMKDWYATKLPLLSYLDSVYATDAPDSLVAGFIAKSQQHMDRIYSFILHELPGYLPESGSSFIEGPTAPGEADFHVAAWLARIVFVSGAQRGEGGMEALGKAMGEPVPEKVVKYWDAWAETKAWKKIYGERLH